MLAVPDNSKYIRTQYLGDIDKAFFDVEKLMSFQQTLPNNFKSMVMSAYTRLRRLLRDDRLVLETGIRPESFVTENQVLRLLFLTEPPRCVEEGEVVQFRCCIGNEFGLWDRANLKNRGALYLGSNSTCPELIVNCEVLTPLLEEQKQHNISVEWVIGADRAVGHDGKVCCVER